ncbi:MAG: HD domain-containing protein [bacterium]|nr:HD domain-containing protein [bacterium]
MIPMEQNRKEFEELMGQVTRPGIDALMKYIKASDMYTAPASTRFHLSVEGGLLQHSLNVFHCLEETLVERDGMYLYMVCGKVVQEITKENMIIMALLHDICKTHFYHTVMKWKKDDNNQWYQYPSYEVVDKIPYGHGEKSVMMIDEFMRLEPVERYAIRWHMGYTDDSNMLTLSNAIEKYPIIWALHDADQKATHFLEDTAGNLE